MDNDYKSLTDQMDIGAYVVSGLNKAVLMTSAFGLIFGGFLVSVFAH